MLKSFNPWLKIINGIMITILAFLSLFSSRIPVIWIGGFILGISLIVNGFQQWKDIKKIDKIDYF